jgi:N-acetylneuraminic acid mutarotase
LHHAAAASFGKKLYVVGGYLADGRPSEKLLVYDPTLDEWNELSPMLTARGALTANFAGGTLYAIGGASTSFGTGGPLNITEAYDPLTDRWAGKQGMPTPRQHLASAVSNEKIHVMGGRIDSLSSNLDSNEVYDPAKDEWTSLAPMPSKRGGLAAASSADGWIYVFGGEEPAGTFQVVERYSADGDSWKSAPDMPNARHGLAAVAVGNEIHVIGGGPRPGLTVGDLNQILHTSQMIQ